MKAAPLIEELKKEPAFKYALVHTGQHYNFKMSEVFFKELKIPKPKYNLNVGSVSPAGQISRIMQRLERVLLKEKPGLVVVMGDINSTLAAALTAVKTGIPLAHIESGLRSFNKKMPEETNRIIVDHISDYLFVSEQDGIDNLIKEGISTKKIFYVGNIMIDTLLKSKPCKRKKGDYAVLTLHRQENVDNKKVFNQILKALGKIPIEIIWPVHPRIKNFKRTKNMKIVNPLGYLEFISLINNSCFVMTDSGGVQEETTFLNIPCLTLRTETERPVTVSKGTNIIAGIEEKEIIKQAKKILSGKVKKARPIKYWDGHAAKRIVKAL